MTASPKKKTVEKKPVDKKLVKKKTVVKKKAPVPKKQIIKELIDEIVTVSDEQIVETMFLLTGEGKKSSVERIQLGQYSL